jgi:MFS family permease
VLGGIGWGFGYISPVSNLMKWFPDRRGLATGMALASFGGGAILAAPLNKMLTDHFSALPTYVGAVDAVDIVTVEGQQCVVDGATGAMHEVVVASAADLASRFPGAEAGVYLVGTGDSGAMGCFVALAGLHCTAMTIGALTMKVPADGWLPDGWTPPSEEENANAVNQRALGVVDHNAALRTSQFWLMWAAVFGNAIAGVSIISCAKTMMGEVFGAALPAVVTGGFATGYVASLSAANGGGRFAWATISDFIGRKQSYFVFGLGIPVAVSIPYVTGMVTAATAGGAMTPLYLFYGGTFMVVSFYGGLFSVLPAYIADTFGIKHAGAIHGRLLTAWAASALVGPSILTSLRGSSYEQACIDLAAKCNPQLFEEKFGAGVGELQALVDAKTVTISRLLEILPAGTLDPTPAIYDSTMYTMAGIMGCAVVCNALIKPFPAGSPHFHKEEEAGAEQK